MGSTYASWSWSWNHSYLGMDRGWAKALPLCGWCSWRVRITLSSVRVWYRDWVGLRFHRKHRYMSGNKGPLLGRPHPFLPSEVVVDLVVARLHSSLGFEDSFDSRLITNQGQVLDSTVQERSVRQVWNGSTERKGDGESKAPIAHWLIRAWAANERKRCYKEVHGMRDRNPEFIGLAWLLQHFASSSGEWSDGIEGNTLHLWCLKPFDSTCHSPLIKALLTAGTSSLRFLINPNLFRQSHRTRTRMGFRRTLTEYTTFFHARTTPV